MSAIGAIGAIEYRNLRHDFYLNLIGDCRRIVSFPHVAITRCSAAAEICCRAAGGDGKLPLQVGSLILDDIIDFRDSR